VTARASTRRNGCARIDTAPKSLFLVAPRAPRRSPYNPLRCARARAPSRVCARTTSIEGYARASTCICVRSVKAGRIAFARPHGLVAKRGPRSERVLPGGSNVAMRSTAEFTHLQAKKTCLSRGPRLGAALSAALRALRGGR
jgi:hypothetical protein